MTREQIYIELFFIALYVSIKPFRENLNWIVSVLGKKLLGSIIEFKRWWKPSEIVKAINDGKLEDYDDLLKDRNDVKLSEEQLKRANKLTKAFKLLQRNN